MRRGEMRWVRVVLLLMVVWNEAETELEWLLERAVVSHLCKTG